MTAKAEEAAKRGDKAQDLVVISPLKSWTCAECSGTGDLLTMDDAGPLCLSCADLDHLVYLPAGDAALTRRAKKASVLSAVVVRFSRSRRRYERQGVLVEEDALNRAERECLADEESRARRKLREGERRTQGDAELEKRAIAEILRHYPGCPEDRAEEIAHHAFTRGSGRIGRTAAGRDLDPEALNLAVAAAVRHMDTPYDELLMGGMDRLDARAHVRAEVEQVMAGWRELPAQAG
jgi:ribosomal protein L14